MVLLGEAEAVGGGDEVAGVERAGQAAEGVGDAAEPVLLPDAEGDGGGHAHDGRDERRRHAGEEAVDAVADLLAGVGVEPGDPEGEADEGAEDAEADEDVGDGEPVAEAERAGEDVGLAEVVGCAGVGLLAVAGGGEEGGAVPGPGLRERLARRAGRPVEAAWRRAGSGAWTAPSVRWSRRASSTGVAEDEARKTAVMIRPALMGARSGSEGVSARTAPRQTRWAL